MVIGNLDIRRTRTAVGPLEADTPAIIDANTELPFAVSRERLEAVAGQRSQVAKGSRCIQAVQFEPRRAFKRFERLHSIACGEVSRALVAIADDHELE